MTRHSPLPNTAIPPYRRILKDTPTGVHTRADTPKEPQWTRREPIENPSHAGGEDEPRHFASEPGQTGRGIVVNVINEPVNGIKELVNGINELINGINESVNG